MTGIGRRVWPLAGVALLLAGLVTGCGNDSKSSSAPAATPAPAVTSASPLASGSACADVQQVKQSVDDLQKALTGKDLAAGKTAWSSLTAAVTSLGSAAKTSGSAAAQSLHDLLAPITENFSDMDTLGKLGALVASLVTVGPALNSAIDSTKQSLSCP